MFIRAELKNQAKQIMKSRYFVMVLVSLIASFLTVSILNVELNPEAEAAVLYLFGRFRFSVNYQRAIQMALPAGIVGILWTIFVVNPARVGICRYFKNCTNSEEKFEDVLSGLKENYAHHVKVLAIMELQVFLWTLLLIVPGIMKAYSYYFVPYLLSDYPELDEDEIFALSEKMTKGIRFRIFVLNLSFFWWYLLVSLTSGLTFGMGSVLLQPYVSQTEAQLYHWAKENRLVRVNESEVMLDGESNLV